MAQKVATAKNTMSVVGVVQPAHAPLTWCQRARKSLNDAIQALFNRCFPLQVDTYALFPNYRRTIDAFRAAPTFAEAKAILLRRPVEVALPPGTIVQVWTQLWKQSRPNWVLHVLSWLRGESNIDYDPIVQRNIPYHSCDIGPTQLIRMGTATRTRGIESTEITPEFRTYIEGLGEGERHLYINLQKRHSLLGRDKIRSRMIESFEGPKLKVIGLAKNSDFWRQKVRGSITVVDFHAKFCAELLGETHYNLEDERIERVFDAVSQRYFARAQTLNEQERGDFIELAHAHYIIDILQQEQPTTANISCKDAIDRAAATTALVLAILGRSEEEIKTALFTPALLVRSRPPNKERFSRFQTAYARVVASRR